MVGYNEGAADRPAPVAHLFSLRGRGPPAIFRPRKSHVPLMKTTPSLPQALALAPLCGLDTLGLALFSQTRHTI